MTSEDRLREYVEKDEIYQNFINGILKANDMSDFDKFCVQHCKEIEELLNERSEWIELLGKFKNQQKELIKWLENMLEDETDIFSVVRVKDVLQKYKEIIGDDKE